MRHEKKHTNKSHVTVPLIHCLDRFCIYEFMQKKQNQTSNSHVPVMYT